MTSALRVASGRDGARDVAYMVVACVVSNPDGLCTWKITPVRYPCSCASSWLMAWLAHAHGAPRRVELMEAAQARMYRGEQRLCSSRLVQLLAVRRNLPIAGPTTSTGIHPLRPRRTPPLTAWGIRRIPAITLQPHRHGHGIYRGAVAQHEIGVAGVTNPSKGHPGSQRIACAISALQLGVNGRHLTICRKDVPVIDRAKFWEPGRTIPWGVEHVGIAKVARGRPSGIRRAERPIDVHENSARGAIHQSNFDNVTGLRLERQLRVTIATGGHHPVCRARICCMSGEDRCSKKRENRGGNSEALTQTAHARTLTSRISAVQACGAPVTEDLADKGMNT